jgi:hypothetical protein
MKHHPLAHHKPATSSRFILAGDIVGWIGAAALIVAYVLVSLGCVDGNSIEYQLLNIVGAIGMLILAIARHAVPSAVTNVIWAIIGLIAIFNIVF